MSNVVTLRDGKRWKAVIEYRTEQGLQSTEHYFEELSYLHLIIDHGPARNLLIRCTVTLNRPDEGEGEGEVGKALRHEYP